jgi:transcription elongation factor GreA
MQKIPMTIAGAEKLRNELQHLKTVVRPKVIDAIAEARGHGDLKENAEYHAAKEQQGFIEGRIREIEHKLGSSQVIDLSDLRNDGKVVFGARITLINLDTDQEASYQIVGEDEADLKAGKISITSPIARAAIGKNKGEMLEVQAPAGTTSYEITEVIYS